MSRRDSSRVHIAVRQNDTLAEFENFKKKFLFANKQITKQNCSLSMKIEELNAHISTLYVENLRLRASEIALQSQLKREKVKSHKIMADAEGAVLNLLKHFGIIRESYNVPTERPRSPRTPADSPPPVSRSRDRPPRSPSAPRLAQLPSVPDIEEEPELRDSSEENAQPPEFPAERMSSLISSRRRSSISRLPVPSRVSTPPPGSIAPSLDEDIITTSTTSRKRKLTRRASGIISSTSEPAPRPISPVLGSPMQQDIELSAEEEAAAMQDVEDIAARGEGKDQEMEKKPRKKSKTREEGEVETIEKRNRKKLKDRESSSAARLKDVTNSPRRRRPHKSTGAERESADEECKEELPNSGRPSLSISPPSKLLPDDAMSYLPTPLPSSVTNTPVTQSFALPSSDGEMNVNGRERRARKSVNYAEPKLNKKMRKPDSIPPPGARPSLSTIPSSTSVALSSSSSSSSSNHNQIRRSMGESSPEPDDAEVAPTSRPSSSVSSKETNSSGRRSTMSALSSAPAIKRKRVGLELEHMRTPSEEGMATDERDYSDDDAGEEEDETDGGEEADSEFTEFRKWATTNAYNNSRRKSVMQSRRSGRNGDVRGGAGSDVEDGPGRRHSLAV